MTTTTNIFHSEWHTLALIECMGSIVKRESGGKERRERIKNCIVYSTVTGHMVGRQQLLTQHSVALDMLSNLHPKAKEPHTRQLTKVQTKLRAKEEKIFAIKPGIKRGRGHAYNLCDLRRINSYLFTHFYLYLFTLFTK